MSVSKRISNVTSRLDVTSLSDTPKDSNGENNKSAKKSRGWNKLNPFFIKGYDMPLTLEEQLVKSEIRNSYDQKIPFSVSRHVLLALYFTLIVLTNRLFFGWPSLSNLLYQDGTYIWKCRKNPDGTYISEDENKRYSCKDQDAAVQNIFIVGSSAYYTVSFFNGLIVDYLGSRLSMLLGHTFNYLGWILLLFSTESFDAFILGGILIGASIDLGSFSTLNISGLYPSSENLVVNIISGAGSLSTGTMLLLDLVISGFNLNFKTFMFVYISITVAFFFILTIFTFPRTRFFRQYELDNYYKNKELEMESKKTNVGESSITTELKEETAPENLSLDKVKVYSLRKIHEAYDDSTSAKNSPITDLEASNLSEDKIKRSASMEEKKNNDIDSSETNVKKKKYFGKMEDLEDLYKICISLHFLGLWIYGPLNAIYNNFYFSIVENILSTEKNNILGFMLPFSFIPCILLGNITDKYGIMLMFFYELFFAFAMYGTSYIHGNFWQWASVLCGTLYSACANGQLWTFISYTFSSRYQSTLIGILNLVAGLISLVRILLLRWAKKVNYDFTYINLLMIVFIGINTAITCYIIFVRKKYGEKVTIGDKNA